MTHRRFVSALLGAAAGMALMTGVAAAEVTYEQILADPGDLQLTYTYAREQMRAGQLEQAAGALERILLLEPNWDSARLLYAVVLYRLDDQEGAKRELAILQGRELSPALAGQVDRYLEKADRKSQSVRVSGSLSVGVGYDSNPTLASTGDAIEIYTYDYYYPYISLGEDGPEADGMFVADARFRIEADLGTGSGDYMYARARGRVNQQFHENEVDYSRAEFAMGAKFFLGDLSITPEAYYAAVGLGDDFLRNEVGGMLGLEYVVTPGFALLASGGGAWLDYEDRPNEAGDRRDGWHAWGGGGFRAQLSDRNTFELQARYHARDAVDEAYSFHGYEIAASDRHLLGMGQYILAEVNYWHIQFEDELLIYDDPFFEPGDIYLPEREDERVKARIAYGLPLSTLASAFGKKETSGLDSFNLQISAGYFWQDSNISAYDTENWSGELLLTKRFGM